MAFDLSDPRSEPQGESANQTHESSQPDRPLVAGHSLDGSRFRGCILRCVLTFTQMDCEAEKSSAPSVLQPVSDQRVGGWISQFQVGADVCLRLLGSEIQPQLSGSSHFNPHVLLSADDSLSIMKPTEDEGTALWSNVSTNKVRVRPPSGIDQCCRRLPAGFMSSSKQQTKRPLQTAPPADGAPCRRRPGSRTRGGRSLAAHRPAAASPSPAAGRRPAGLLNDTGLVACRCASFLIFTAVVGGSLSFDSRSELIRLPVRM
ncbi:unnamed protein product [Pleuronectes platessa]|uniref:Uncharacterized protein n=1 Tax=Pleuronectes platessa TaxID=8262 RepID=A0A9N7Y8S0_PLEPL|nr:unnamed protein product [Pleuronectes platessa]